MANRYGTYLQLIDSFLPAKSGIGKGLVFFVFIFLFLSETHSQKSVGTLKSQLDHHVSDTMRIALLNELGKAYTYSSTDSALFYTKKALSTAKNLNFEKGIAKSKYQLTLIYRLLGDYPKALNNGFESLKYFTKVQGKPEIAGVLTHLGGVYFRLQDYDKALSYYQESLKIRNELEDEIGQASQFVGIGLVYENLFQFERALTYYRRALTINRKKAPPLNTAINLVNIGDLYLNQNRYQEALPYFFESYDINRKIDNQQGVASVTRHLAQLYQKTGEIRKSIEYATISLKVANKIKRKVIASEVCLILSENYSNLEKYQKALEFYHLHTKYKDSLYNAAKLKELSSLESRYAVQQKEQELKIQEQTIALLNQDSKIDRLWRNVMAVGLILTGLFAFLIYKLQQLRNRKNRQLLASQQMITLKLQELDEAKSQFFANISHEFRTPLTLIKGPIDQLSKQSGQKLDKDSLEMIQRNTDRLLKLVNQLLDLSKLDAGNLKLEETEANLFGFLRAISSSFDSHAIERNITYTVHIPPIVLWACFDQDKMEKVMYNLLSNAFKFSSSGSVITLDVKPVKQKLQIVVEDTGSGIEASQLQHIFDRFYRADNNTAREGTGIGLALTKELVELMGGNVNVRSQVGRGSAFTVTLPLKLIQSKARPATTIKPGFKQPKAPQPIKVQEFDTRDLPAILLVEDNQDMRNYISNLLSTSFRVQNAKNGAVGLKKALANPPDLVITDLMMPEMDGIQFCKFLKTKIVTSHIPIIMLTAKSGTEHKIEGLETGADDYLIKPFEPNELLVRVKNLIHQRKQLRARYGSAQKTISPKEITVNSVDRSFLENVHRLLEDHYMDPDFGVPKLHKAMALSRAQFHRKIRALTNETPGVLLRNFRLKRPRNFFHKMRTTLVK